ncbi:MAG: M28 family peptidase [Acidobacteriota bacterium]
MTSRGTGPHLTLVFLLVLLVFPGCAAVSGEQPHVTPERVMNHLERIVGYGPHPPGSPAQKQVGLYILQQLKSYGLPVHTEAFEPLTPKGPLEMINIWGVAKGEKTSVIILASHYDSKLFDNFRFVGANDGGSSTALLLELARVLANNNPTRHTLWFVFFDGEEAIEEWTPQDSLYGSREFVRALRRQSRLSSVAAMILLDLVGGKDLRLFQDVNSTGWLRSIIWKRAQREGYSNIFQPTGTTAAEDDHMPFAAAGIPVVDIIDLRYAHWHQAGDTLDKLSAENMAVVGDVLLGALAEIGRRLDSGR